MSAQHAESNDRARRCKFLILLSVASLTLNQFAVAKDLRFGVRLETVLEHDDGKFLWYHPRVSAVPSATGTPLVLMTLQKHLNVSDYYSGLFMMRRAGADAPWEGPV